VRRTEECDISKGGVSRELSIHAYMDNLEVRVDKLDDTICVSLSEWFSYGENPTRDKLSLHISAAQAKIVRDALVAILAEKGATE